MAAIVLQTVSTKDSASAGRGLPKDLLPLFLFQILPTQAQQRMLVDEDMYALH
jgi:hypothetical protein